MRLTRTDRRGKRNAALAALAVGLATFAPTARAVAEPAQTSSVRRSRPYVDHVLATVDARTDREVSLLWRNAEHVLSPHDPHPQRHEIVVSKKTLAKLRSLGLRVNVSAVDVQSLVDKSYEKAPPRAHDYKLNLFDSFFSEVQPLSAIQARLEELAARGSAHASLVELGKSIQNRGIVALRVSSAPAGLDRPTIVVLGTQHAREWASPMVTMAIADALISQYDENENVRTIVEHLDVYIVPVSNPDGYVATHEGERMQRRNMHADCNVDLNRNYDEAFGQGVEDDCQSDTYPGSAAFSEPESRAIRELIASCQRPALLLDYHSTASQIMIPYAYTQTKPAGYERNKQLAELYSAALEQVNDADVPARDGYELAHGQGGGALDWFRAKYANSLAVELREGGAPSGFGIDAEGIIEQAEENWVAWLALASELADEEIVTNPPDSGGGAAGAAGVGGGFGGAAGQGGGGDVTSAGAAGLGGIGVSGFGGASASGFGGMDASGFAGTPASVAGVGGARTTPALDDSNEGAQAACSCRQVGRADQQGLLGVGALLGVLRSVRKRRRQR